MRYARLIVRAWVAVSVVVAVAALAVPSAHATFAGTNGKLVFDRGVVVPYGLQPVDIYTANADGTGLKRILHNDYINWQATWSPDGTKIAFASNMNGGTNHENDNFNIYLMNADGSHIQQITRGPDTTWQPTWSPDGTKIAYSTNRTGYFHIWYKTLATGVTTQVTSGRDTDAYPDWAPSGTKIAFTRLTGTNEDVWVKVIGGDSAWRVTSQKGVDSWPSWSPDGTMIAFSSNRSGNYNIYTVTSSGTNLVQRTTNANFDGHAAWSPDGGRLVFTSGRTGYRNIWILTLTGGVKMVTNATSGYFEFPDWQIAPA